MLVPGADRLKAIRLLKNQTGWRHGTPNIKAEGSLAVQKTMFYAIADWAFYKVARKGAHIRGWEDHPYFGILKDRDGCLEPGRPPVERSYDL